MRDRVLCSAFYLALLSGPAAGAGPQRVDLLGQRLGAGIVQGWRTEAQIAEDQGRFGDRVRLLRQALAVAEKLWDPVLEGRVAASLGRALRSQGQVEEGLQRLEKAVELFDRAGAALDLLFAQEALIETQKHLGLPQSPTVLAHVQEGKQRLFALLPNSQAQQPGAETTDADLRRLLEGIRAFAPLSLDPEITEMEAILELLVELGDPKRSSEALVKTEKLLENCSLDPQLCAAVRVAAHLTRAQILDDAGDPVAAKRENQSLQEVAEAAGDPDFAAKIQTMRALELWQEGRREEAMSLLDQSLRSLETLASGIRTDAVKTRYLATDVDILFEAYLRMLLESERYLEAFELTERARARALLAGFGHRAQPPEAEPCPTLRVERAALLAERAAARQGLAAALTQPERRAAEERLLRADREWEAHLVTCSLVAAPDAGIEPATATAAEVAAGLPADTTMVSYFQTRFGSFVWVIDREFFGFFPLPFTAESAERVARWVSQLSADGGRDGRGARRTEARQMHLRREAEALYDQLIHPIRPYLRQRRLLLIPHGNLHSLPFAALVERSTGRHLIEDFTLTSAPSATLALTLRRTETPFEGRALVLGAPTTALSPLPGAEREARLIATILGTTAALGADAHEGRLAGREPVDLLHLAAHAFFDPQNPSTSHVALTPGGARDGRLELAEIPTVFLGRGLDLVVLSACETARGQRSTGDEVIGLTRAFLLAGSAGVLSTLWPIDDPATAELMRAFYRQWRTGQAVAEALRRAQLELLGNPETAHPALWAAFRLTGDPTARWF